ncbi:FAD-dependent monooxygenase [Paraburkholderia bengalensis]|uniref:FAD-dependent monooxygenase n=1 Tax=Paraburkholderia bengalensis TaxID=2747562 RepID=UPI003015543F
MVVRVPRSHRIASAYGRGRAFIAGDAAHIHPPVGGQGMNTGLQDAHNLAWKLAYVARGVAGPALLDSYSAERHPVGVDVVHSTSAALNAVLAREGANPAMRDTQLLITYRGSAIVDDMCADADPALPAPGDRLPDACGLSQHFVGHPRRLHEYIGRGRHTLIGYIDAAGPQYDAFVNACRTLDATLPEEAASAVLVAAPGLRRARRRTDDRANRHVGRIRRGVSAGGRRGVDRAARWTYRLAQPWLCGGSGERLAGAAAEDGRPGAIAARARTASAKSYSPSTNVRAGGGDDLTVN